MVGMTEDKKVSLWRLLDAGNLCLPFFVVWCAGRKGRNAPNIVDPSNAGLISATELQLVYGILNGSSAFFPRPPVQQL